MLTSNYCYHNILKLKPPNQFINSSIFNNCWNGMERNQQLDWRMNWLASVWFKLHSSFILLSAFICAHQFPTFAFSFQPLRANSNSNLTIHSVSILLVYFWLQTQTCEVWSLSEGVICWMIAEILQAIHSSNPRKENDKRNWLRKQEDWVMPQAFEKKWAIKNWFPNESIQTEFITPPKPRPSVCFWLIHYFGNH